MTRRDYVVLARLLGRIDRAIEPTGCTRLTREVAAASSSLFSYLQADNPRFNGARFADYRLAVAEGRDITS